MNSCRRTRFPCFIVVLPQQTQLRRAGVFHRCATTSRNVPKTNTTAERPAGSVEFGTIRLLGNRSRSILLLVVSEALLLRVIGGALGLVWAHAGRGDLCKPPSMPPKSALVMSPASGTFLPIMLAAFLVGGLAGGVAGAPSPLELCPFP